MTSLIPLFVLAAIAALLLALSVRAFLVEREEGLPRSTKRVAVAGVLAAALTGIAVFAALPSGSDNGPSTSTLDPALAEVKQQIDEKQAKLDSLRESERALRDEISALEKKGPGLGHAATAQETEENVEGRRAAAMQVGALVLVVGLGSMLFLGDPRTLLLRRKRARSDEGRRAPLDALAQAAHDGAYEEGIRAAETIEEAALDALDLIDFLFLRAYCRAQHASTSKDATVSKRALYESAVKDGERLVELAPNMGEAHYLLASARHALQENGKAAESIARAEALLGAPAGLPFVEARSVCLLRHGEKLLGEADTAGAKRCFDEVARLGVLAKEVPFTMITQRLIEVQRDVAAGKLEEAAEGIARVREIHGLDDARRLYAEVSCAAYELLILHRRGEHVRVVSETEKFLAGWLPKDLPAADEQAADEYLFPAVAKESLKLPAELMRGLFFLEAVGRVRIATKLPAGDEVTALARPLLRALQFEPRHREVLASLGALYVFCKPEARAKGMEWLDAAIAMGAKSPIARRWLERERTRELERATLLDRFRAAASRFLSDGMVDPRVREALLEELGRFQDFRPLLLELREGHAEDPIINQPPTVAALRERALYIQDVAAQALARESGERAAALGQVKTEYGTLVEVLERSSTRMSELEKRVMEEVGRLVFT